MWTKVTQYILKLIKIGQSKKKILTISVAKNKHGVSFETFENPSCSGNSFW